MANNTDRDDVALKHFKARAAQPHALYDGMPTASGTPVIAPINIYLSTETPFSCVSDEIDAIRFTYRGTSPSITPYEASGAYKTNMNCMRSGFIW